MPRSVIRRLALVAAFLVAVTACSATPEGGGSAPGSSGCRVRSRTS